MRVRREKRERILDEGRQAYPVEVPRTHSLAEVRQQWAVKPKEDDPEAAEKLAALPEGATLLGVGEETDTVVGVAGRVMFVRNTGKLAFATLQDGDGTQLQGMLSQAEVGAEALDRWKAEVDLGDIVFAKGRVISSRRGELSVMAEETDTVVVVAAPVMSDTTTGRSAFATQQDGDGSERAVGRARPEVCADALDRWKAEVDRGDSGSAKGRVISSRRGELSVMARER